MTRKTAAEPRPPPPLTSLRTGAGVALDVLCANEFQLAAWSRRKRKAATDTLRRTAAGLTLLRETIDEARLRLAEGHLTYDNEAKPLQIRNKK